MHCSVEEPCYHTQELANRETRTGKQRKMYYLEENSLSGNQTHPFGKGGEVSSSLPPLPPPKKKKYIYIYRMFIENNERQVDSCKKKTLLFLEIDSTSDFSLVQFSMIQLCQHRRLLGWSGRTW